MNKFLYFLQSTLASLLHPLESFIDRLKYRHTGRKRIVIQAYRGFGAPSHHFSPGRLFLKGRVLEDPVLYPVTPEDGLWRNLVNSYKRFESDEIPFARLKVYHSGGEIEVTANEEGFFTIDLEDGQPIRPPLEVYKLDLNLLEPLCSDQPPVTAQGEVLLLPDGARFAVISDIDDTVVLTKAANPLRTIWTLVSRNAYTRIPFPGTAALYTALWQGATSTEHNPIFYVSTSPWNIYDMLEKYLQVQDFPQKPVFHLRDWGITQREIIPMEHKEHKTIFIRQVLDMYPHIPLILIGDSSQQDPEIYAGIASEFPQRILAIYLREVTRNPRTIDRIHRMRGRLARLGVPAILANDVLPMAQHASDQGWITPSGLERVRRDLTVSTS